MHIPEQSQTVFTGVTDSDNQMMTHTCRTKQAILGIREYAKNNGNVKKNVTTKKRKKCNANSVSKRIKLSP